MYKSQHKQIEFDLPQITFKDDEYIHVNEIAIFFKEPVKNLIGILETTLIEKTPMNSNQQLIYFKQLPKAINMLYSPTHISKYKIQRSSLDTAEFKLRFTDEVKIGEIYFQIEITDGKTGIQQICKRSL